MVVVNCSRKKSNLSLSFRIPVFPMSQALMVVEHSPMECMVKSEQA